MVMTEKKPQPRNRRGVQNDGARDPRLVEIGDRIKTARLEKQLEQKHLAELVGVTEKTVSNWEIGLHSPHNSIREISAALGVSESFLLHGQHPQPAADVIVKLGESQRDLLRSILDELRLLRLDRMEQHRLNDRPT